jgi:hypothetical protein
VIFTLVYLIPYPEVEGAVEHAPEAVLRLAGLGERLFAALPF